ncbi:hypothetical protein, partial [Pseudomonas helleri]|uniref:hypothetical protein n=1 Tax=Pseudomonas helleri TaxID=1608996 RepID=UPI001E5FF8FB
RGTDNRLHQQSDEIAFSTIYETQDVAQAEASDVLSSLEQDDDTVVSVPDGRRFRVRHGSLDNGKDVEGVWRASTKSTDQWLATVEA